MIISSISTRLPIDSAISRRRAMTALASIALGSAAVTTDRQMAWAKAAPQEPAIGDATGFSRESGRRRTWSGAMEDQSKPTETTTFVLVHGGWHGGWCWSRVMPALRSPGHTVWAPTLTGLADRSHALTPDIDLETHIRDVIGLLEYEDLERVILVGHSYAGMVVTGVAARVPERVAHLVYLDAFVPDEGDSLSRLLPPEREYFYRREAVIRGQGWRIPPPPTAALGLSDESDVAWVEARLTDQPLRTFDQPLAMGAPAEMPRTYIACTEGPIVASFARFAAQAQSEPHWGYHELPTGHDAMITMPEPLANLLLGLTPDRA